MKFCWTTIRVRNMEASMKFYHEILNLPIDLRQTESGTDMVMLGGHDWPKVELLSVPAPEPAEPGTAVSIGFEVDSLEETLGMLKEKGIAITRDIMSHGPLRFFFVNDPDGVSVQFVEMKR